MERGKGHGGLRSPPGGQPPPPVAPQGALGKVLSRQHGAQRLLCATVLETGEQGLPPARGRPSYGETEDTGVCLRALCTWSTCIHVQNMHDTRMVFGIRSRIESAVNVQVAFLSLRIFTRSAKPAPPCPPPRRSPRGATTPEESPRDPTRALRVIPDTGVPPGPHSGTAFDH